MDLFYWIGSDTVRVVVDMPNESFRVIYEISGGEVCSELMQEATDKLKKEELFVYEVTYVEEVYARILCNVKEGESFPDIEGFISYVSNET